MKRLLLIEDDEWLAQSYIRMIKASGSYKVQYYGSLEEAIRAVDTQLPDVIIVDFMLEGKNSLQLLHELSSYEDTAKVPIILCSTIGAELSEYAPTLRSYGVVSVLDKSDITPELLQRALHEAIVEHAS